MNIWQKVIMLSYAKNKILSLSLNRQKKKSNPIKSIKFDLESLEGAAV